MSELLYFLAGVVVTWIVGLIYYSRSTKDLRAEVKRLSSELERRDTVEYFEMMLLRGTWSLHSVDGHDTWVLTGPDKTGPAAG